MFAPEKPTVAERFVQILPVRYPLAALIWSLLLAGPTYYFIQSFSGSSPAPSLGLLFNQALNVLLPFYIFLTIRYMRLRIVALEVRIVPRLSGGGQDYRRLFGRVSQTAPIIILTVIFGTLLLILYKLGGVLPVAPALILANIFVVYLNALAFSNYLWVFIVASVGLRKLGGSPSMKLESFLDDRMMGARPMASLALSLTGAYFGGLLLTFLLLGSFLPSSVASGVAFYCLIMAGVGLFFLPLNSVHKRMQAEKRRLLRELSSRYPRSLTDQSPSKENATLDDVRNQLAKLTELQELEMLERKVASLPTWPFDIQVLGKLITIVISVIAAFLARILIDIILVKSGL